MLICVSTAPICAKDAATRCVGGADFADKGGSAQTGQPAVQAHEETDHEWQLGLRRCLTGRVRCSITPAGWRWGFCSFVLLLSTVYSPTLLPSGDFLVLWCQVHSSHIHANHKTNNITTIVNIGVKNEIHEENPTDIKAAHIASNSHSTKSVLWKSLCPLTKDLHKLCTEN